MNYFSVATVHESELNARTLSIEEQAPAGAVHTTAAAAAQCSCLVPKCMRFVNQAGLNQAPLRSRRIISQRLIND